MLLCPTQETWHSFFCLTWCFNKVAHFMISHQAQWLTPYVLPAVDCSFAGIHRLSLSQKSSMGNTYRHHVMATSSYPCRSFRRCHHQNPTVSPLATVLALDCSTPYPQAAVAAAYVQNQVHRSSIFQVYCFGLLADWHLNDPAICQMQYLVSHCALLFSLCSKISQPASPMHVPWQMLHPAAVWIELIPIIW